MGGFLQMYLPDNNILEGIPDMLSGLFLTGTILFYTTGKHQNLCFPWNNLSI